MKVALVTITRLGNKYLREFVWYYKSIGVDKMYFYDNNQDGEEKVISALYEHVKRGYVEIIDFGDKVGKIQELAYQDFYNKHGNEYDWVGCIDDDEYVFMNNTKNIKEFLSQEKFNGKNGVSFPMINFSDSGVIVNNKQTRLDVYTELSFPENPYSWSFYKTFVRGGLNVNYLEKRDDNGNLIFGECCHVPIVNDIIGNNIVDCDGNIIVHDPDRNIYISITQYITHDAFLKHVPTGCIDDFISMKHSRGWPDTTSEMRNDCKNKFNFDYFLRYNEYSEEKYQYYLTHGG